MQTRTRISAVLAAVAALTVATAAQASFFVRPVLQYNGEFIDGYSGNDQTQASLTFNDGFQSFESHVDLADGTIKTYLEMNGPSTGFGIVTGVMGDRIRYTGANGMASNFSFAFDGQIDVNQFATYEGSTGTRTVLIQAHFAVYDASAGATYKNWALQDSNAPKALLVQYVPISFDYDAESFSEFVFNADLGGDLNLVSGNSYDVFAAFNLIAQPGANIGPITMNFLNTSTIGITAAEGGSFTSQSGAFLGFAATPGVPEPSQWAMLIIGFGVVGGMSRRKRSLVAA